MWTQLLSILIRPPTPPPVESTGVKQVRVLMFSNEKTRVIAMLACTTDGCKLAPLLVFKHKMVPKSVNFLRGVLLCANEKGWMDNDLVIDSIDHVWINRPGASLGLHSTLFCMPFL